MIHNLRRTAWTRMGLGLAAWLLPAAGARAADWSALAQVVTTRSYTVEIAIVVIFTGAALFAVCRSGD